MGLLNGLLGKAITGVTNLIKNAKAGKAALAQGFVPGAMLPNVTLPGQPQNTTTGPQDPVPWYKQAWIVPLSIGLTVISIIVGAMLLFNRRR